MDEVDRNGFPVEVYPNFFRGARLLGVNADGVAEYYTGEVVFYVLYDGETLEAPPPDYGPGHGLLLAAMDWSIGEYLHHASEDRGPYRFMSLFARGKLGAERG